MSRIPQTALKGAQFPNSIDVTELEFDPKDKEDGENREPEDWEVVFRDFLSSKPTPNAASDESDSSSSKIPIGLSLLHSLVTGKDRRSHLVIRFIAFSTSKRVLLIKAPASGFAKIPWDDRRSALKSLLAGETRSERSYILVAFELGSIALSIYRECSLLVKAVDLSGPLKAHPGFLPSTVIAESKDLGPFITGQAFKEIWRKPFRSGDESGEPTEEFRTLESSRIALRAWLTKVAADKRLPAVEKATAINMIPDDSLTSEHIDILAKIQTQFDLLEAIKPEKTSTEFSAIVDRGTGEVGVKQTTFKNKMRKGAAQDVRFLKGDTVQFEGQVTDTSGKEATVTTSTAVEGVLDEETGESKIEIDTIEIIGREDLTGADKARVSCILGILQRVKENPFLIAPLIRKIWCPTDEDKEEMQAATSKLKEEEVVEEGVTPGPVEIGGIGLNSSQAKVAQAMLSSEPGDNFALVHGPPGTGKTRSIAAVVLARFEAGKTSYLVAQSNVGVKNIAETLAEKHNFTQFKLLVSGDFYTEWHEHIYEPCREQILTSEQLRDKKLSFREAFAGIKVVLSTVDMLFQSTLQKKGLFGIIPVEYLVVDEASQIYCGSYLALLDKFQATLKKVCWFGDPRQLPPHQREQISGLDSIYDIPHVSKASMLLDTQYRMPVPIGQFISRNVYDSKLKSSHSIKDLDCLKLVDVEVGFEEVDKTSWINKEEVNMIVHAVRNYYSELKFCVITPYDAQRKALDTALKKASLPSNCYNVDSFQGNEEEYILISTVRTSGTGFLDLDNRVNVMLTRCKKGMVIFTHKGFIRRDAAHSLVGILAQEWVRRRGGSEKEALVWVSFAEIVKGTANLPGKDGVREGEEMLPQKPKPIAPSSPSGFQAAPRTSKGVSGLFNGLTSPTGRSGANIPVSSTQRKGGMTFVTPVAATRPTPTVPARPAGPTAPTASFGIARPAIPARSSTTPGSGAWAAGSPLAGQRIGGGPLPSWPGAAPASGGQRLGGGSSSGRAYSIAPSWDIAPAPVQPKPTGSRTIRVGPIPTVNASNSNSNTEPKLDGPRNSSSGSRKTK
ncbi:hypothetical protein FRB94_010188 [Tulasnella sp. JGI-2019a]|nr:hypothetical protein FRB94_010188 [Tulasnella sp. JGI-2019a]KAG9023573.1 hypothetical protein FRB95_012901 [Tulasnella sp. JGI-2019a]